MIASWILVGNCGVALTPRLTATIPPEAKTEAFRLNLLYGEVRQSLWIQCWIVQPYR
ncbi:LA_2272/LA_2273 family lipoprotein [Leptospira santarosai]|uniref:LA_2272/LA_2273 family lipoprotein n=1 Tax=Leptospira santarosai TaxID=28183 RepID=UPI003D15F5A8